MLHLAKTVKENVQTSTEFNVNGVTLLNTPRPTTVYEQCWNKDLSSLSFLLEIIL